jgi:serine/threonine protein kinase
MWSRNIRYELLERLGEGGQGCVFKALRRDPATGLSEMVALKVLHSETAHSLWKQEFESLRRVRSPYCVQLLSFDRVEGRPALVLEFVDGVSLSHLGRSGLLSEEDIAEIVAQIEFALLELNQFGIFHGDLSPANVLVDRDGRIKLLDFGLANTGGPETRVTPDFAAPERLAGGHPSLASDLYSLGAIECFLKGSFSGNKEYLAHDPQLRSPRGQESKAKHRAAIALKIVQWQQRNRWSRNLPTKTLNYGAPKKSPSLNWFIFAAAAILMALSPGAVPHYSTLPLPALLVIRTLNWHRISLNGQPLGYAPVQLAVGTSRTSILEWTSAKGGGRKLLRLRPGQRIVMDDRDFAH